MKIPAKWGRGAIAVSAMSFAAYLGFSIWGDGEAVLDAIRTIGWANIALVLALSLANYALRFARWHLYTRWQGFHIALWRNCAIYLGGFAFTVSPGKAGEAVRGLYMVREGVPHATSLAMLFVERLGDLMAVLVLSTLVLAMRPDLYWVLGLALLLLIGFFLLASSSRMHAGLRQLGAHVGLRIGPMLNWLGGLFEQAGTLLTPRRLAVIFALGLVAWAAEGYGLWILVSSFGNGVTPGLAIGIYSLAVLAGAAAIFMPGGLGGTEAAMTALLVASGLALPVAIAITLLCRLATLWFAVVIGAVSLLALEIADWREGQLAANGVKP